MSQAPSHRLSEASSVSCRTGATRPGPKQAVPSAPSRPTPPSPIGGHHTHGQPDLLSVSPPPPPPSGAQARARGEVGRCERNRGGGHTSGARGVTIHAPLARRSWGAGSALFHSDCRRRVWHAVASSPSILRGCVVLLCALTY
eukprot:scaffold12248_cov110-Isochrysis_galbana.AAC.4